MYNLTLIVSVLVDQQNRNMWRGEDYVFWHNSWEVQ